MSGSLIEVVLDRRCILQPKPAFHVSGDSGACVLASILGSDPQDIYDQFIGSVRPLSRDDVIYVLQKADTDNLIDRLVTATPHWALPEFRLSYGYTSWQLSDEWFDYVRMALDAGYYGLAELNDRHRGPRNGGSSWAMFVGIRETRKPPSRRGARFEQVKREVLVSTPKFDKWIDVSPLLKYQGGYNVILVRPS